MADAEVGDDVLDGDPTMKQLEKTVAELLGHEAALWVPTGCMGNNISLMLHLQRGDKFLAAAQAHIIGSELGTAAWLAQGMPEVIPWSTPGKITPQQVCSFRNGQTFGLLTLLHRCVLLLVRLEHITTCAPRCCVWRTRTTLQGAFVTR